MDEQLTGPTSGEARAPDESERLIREEFGGPASVYDETEPVPDMATALRAGDASVTVGAVILEEFAEPDRLPPRETTSSA
jgi:hypothetical protein